MFGTGETASRELILIDVIARLELISAFGLLNTLSRGLHRRLAISPLATPLDQFDIRMR